MKISETDAEIDELLIKPVQKLRGFGLRKMNEHEFGNLAQYT